MTMQSYRATTGQTLSGRQFANQSSSTSIPVRRDESQPTPPSREPVRVLVIGSRRGVTDTIQTLYHLGFADVRQWSRLLPTQNRGEFMSILTRYVVLD